MEKRDRSDNWKFVTPSTFMQTAPDPDWIIEQVLTPDTELHLYGPEGAGKSRLAWQLGYAIAEGQPLWLDAFRVKKQGKVLWLGVDMESNEMKAMLQDASEAGIMESENIVVNWDRRRLKYDDPAHQKLLGEIGKEFDPLAVVVDNASQMGFHKISNDEILDYLWVFRESFPGAGKIHLNHTRRLSQEMKARGKEDTGGFLGGGEWSRGTRTSMHLQGGYHNPAGKVRITKLRGVLPWVTLNIRRDNHGFWHLDEQSVGILLATWPHCLPHMNGHADSVRSVCRTIADAYPQYTAEAVRSQYKREREGGVKYSWDTFGEEGS
jgi:hypothetical protein